MSAAALAPAAFGRGVIVAAGAAVPGELGPGLGIGAAPRVEVTEATLTAPGEVVARLHERWVGREPVVVSLGVDPARFREPQSLDDPPWSLPPGLELLVDRLHHLVWANNYDARGGEPIWWWGVKATRVGAAESGVADVALPGGTPAWIDGGPRWSVPREGAVVHSSSVDLGFLDPLPEEISPSGAELAPDQLAAVDHHGGPVRVIAPAGSGKTRVLTERMRHVLGDRAYRTESVIAVAYNKQAQLELETRLEEVRPRTKTLNSLGYALLARHRRSRPPVLSEPDVRRLIDDVFPIPRQRRTNTDPVGPYLDALTIVRLGLVDPAEVEAMRDDVPGLADGFESFRARLAGTGAVDFDEQIYATVEALLRDGPFRRSVQAEHRHMLVDEFQDLTPAHVLLIRLLAAPGFDVFGVGDDDQTIYDHAGADPRFLVEYPKYFPGAEATALEVNYRCAEAIVAGASKLLSYNRVRVDKEIRAAAGADPDQAALELIAHPPEDAAATLVGIVRG